MPARKATGGECPFCTICRIKPTGTANTAIIEMSIPRPITTTAIARPRMPRIATFCTKPNSLPLLKKPGRNRAKPMNMSTNNANTLFCWEGRNFFTIIFLGLARSCRADANQASIG